MGRTRRRRTWPQRLLIAGLVLAVLGSAATAGTLAYSNEQVSQVTRRYVPPGVLTSPPASADEPRNYLIVGVDQALGREEEPGDAPASGATGGQLSDTIMVLRLDPSIGSAEVLSVPRDLYVPIAGTGAPSKINAAYATGGVGRLVATLDENFGIPVHHTVEVDFDGFRELVEVVDGVPIHFPRPVRAAQGRVELDIPEAGCWTLGPVQALAFARARYDYAVQGSNGRWHIDPRADFARVERQQLFVQLALRQAIAKGARNPNTLRRLIGVGVGHVVPDTNMRPEDVVQMGLAFRSFDPADLVTHTLPVVDDWAGGGSILRLQEAQAEPVLARFRGETSRSIDVVASEVTVQVRNGTGVDGQASQVSRLLATAGFPILTASTVDPGWPTRLLHAEGAEAAARLVARHVVGPVVYVVEDDLDGADVVLITGDDWEGATATARPEDDVPGPSTTTTTEVEDPDPDGLDGGEGGGPGTDGAASGPPSPDEVEDPGDPVFYQAMPPPPGATCTRTE